MGFNLHRPIGRADWENIPREQWNRFQIRAAETGGIDTPANRLDLIASMAGVANSALIISGHRMMERAAEDDDTMLFLCGGTAKMAGLAGDTLTIPVDFFDGIIADKTGTKSSLGEVVDAGRDMFEASRRLGTRYAIGALSLTEAGLIGAPKLANMGIAGATMLRGEQPHTSVFAKGAEGVRGLALEMTDVETFAETYFRMRTVSDGKMSPGEAMDYDFANAEKVLRDMQRAKRSLIIGAGAVGWAATGIDMLALAKRGGKNV